MFIRRMSCVRVFATFPTNLGHMFSVRANRLAAFATSLLGFFRGELMSSSLLVGRLSASTRYIALFFFVHRSESAICVIFRHDYYS